MFSTTSNNPHPHLMTMFALFPHLNAPAFPPSLWWGGAGRRGGEGEGRVGCAIASNMHLCPPLLRPVPTPPIPSTSPSTMSLHSHHFRNEPIIACCDEMMPSPLAPSLASSHKASYSNAFPQFIPLRGFPLILGASFHHQHPPTRSITLISFLLEYLPRRPSDIEATATIVCIRKVRHLFHSAETVMEAEVIVSSVFS